MSFKRLEKKYNTYTKTVEGHLSVVHGWILWAQNRSRQSFSCGGSSSWMCVFTPEVSGLRRMLDASTPFILSFSPPQIHELFSPLRGRVSREWGSVHYVHVPLDFKGPVSDKMCWIWINTTAIRRWLTGQTCTTAYKFWSGRLSKFNHYSQRLRNILVNNLCRNVRKMSNKHVKCSLFFKWTQRFFVWIWHTIRSERWASGWSLWWVFIGQVKPVGPHSTLTLLDFSHEDGSALPACKHRQEGTWVIRYHDY